MVCLSKPLPDASRCSPCGNNTGTVYNACSKLSLANSSLRPCSEIIPRETVHMKAGLLTPHGGKEKHSEKQEWQSKYTSVISLAEVKDRSGWNHIEKKTERGCFFLFVLWTLFSNNVFSYRRTFVEMLLHVEPCHSVKMLFISKNDVRIGLEK